MKKEIIFIDMDNVLVDFQSGLNKVDESTKANFAKDEDGKPHYDDIPGVFSLMDPMPGAHDAIEKLSKKYDLYILSTAPWDNPSAWQDKLQWVKKYFDDIKRIDEDGKEVSVFYKRLILSHHKDLCCKDGAFLIDDRPNHGATEFGNRWLSFGKNGKYKNWEEVTDFLLHRMEGGNDLETFCEHRGFVCHPHGHGHFGAFPFYTFEKDGFSITYGPNNNYVKIFSHMGTFTGSVSSVEDFKTLIESMKIDFASVEDKEASHNAALDKMKRKLELANRIAKRIQIIYDFNYEKCVDMAMQGDWWRTSVHAWQLSNRYFDNYAKQVIDGIESGKIN